MAEGDGPVNALDAALRKALQRPFPGLDKMHLVDYKVRVINSEAATAAGVRVVIESRDEHDVWGTVGVSENIIEASWIALVDSFEYKLCKDERSEDVEHEASASQRRPAAGCSLTSQPTVALPTTAHMSTDSAMTNFPNNTITPPPKRAGIRSGKSRATSIASPNPARKPYHDRHSAAERDRRAAPGPRPEQHAARHPHPLEADAGLRDASGCPAPITPASPRRRSSSGGC